MRAELTQERRERLTQALESLFRDEFDEDLSPFRARRLVNWFAAELGPPIYNQAIQDARGFIASKLEDLDVEFYEPDPS